MQHYTDNPFYDFVLAWSGDPIPSTRAGYINLPGGGIILKPETARVHKFRDQVREAFREYPEFLKPTTRSVLISLAIGLSPEEYDKRDIDNMVKTLLDALQTVVYHNDRQVVALHVVKFRSEYEIWNIGIKKLQDEDPLWNFPQLYLECPY